MVEKSSDRKVFYSEGMQVYFQKKYWGEHFWFNDQENNNLKEEIDRIYEKNDVTHDYTIFFYGRLHGHIYPTFIETLYSMTMLPVISYIMKWWYIYLTDKVKNWFTKHWFGMFIYKWFWYENYICIWGWHQCIVKKDLHHRNDKQGKVQSVNLVPYYNKTIWMS